MEFNKCNRCGNFFVVQGNVCPKCDIKDNLEFSTFKSYIEENGSNISLENISGQTGISVKSLNRFLAYDGLEGYQKNTENITGYNGIIFN